MGSKDIKEIFPRNEYITNKYMNEDAARDARRWLDESEHKVEQRKHLLEVILDQKQRDFVLEKRESIYRRIKGAAGSGKSLVLAGRAAELSLQKKKVLVVTYNITLMNYLSDLSVRWYGGAARRNITWLNFHEWCRRVAEETGNIEEYRQLWVGSDDNTEHILHKQLPKCVINWISNDKVKLTQRYDAIFVDEGQDFRLIWWNALRKVLNDNGEMMLVADYTQDIYGTSVSWTEEAMKGCGFKGSWSIMDKGYRLPPLLSAYAGEFAKRYITNYPEIAPKIPEEGQKELLLFPCKLKWIQIDQNQDAADICCKEALEILFDSDNDEIVVSDMTILVDNRQLGVLIERKLAERDINSITTFSDNYKEERRRKMAFYMGNPKVKITTIHSFKGWESRALVVFVRKAVSSGGEN